MVLERCNKDMLLPNQKILVLILSLFFMLMNMMLILVDAKGMKIMMKKGSDNNPALMMLAAGIVAKLLRDMGGMNFLSQKQQQQPQVIRIPIWVEEGGGMGHQNMMMQQGGWMDRR